MKKLLNISKSMKYTNNKMFNFNYFKEFYIEIIRTRIGEYV